ncbi:MAG: hypothetical protein NkDv07_0753 [Candidatus Improbicoccus devescovinae]|nr:MAG: hypothetical protein NkDv07_0753 [Candidatus Improbicoccus devescovinae]
MNNFFKNNKMILCIICFVLINTQVWGSACRNPIKFECKNKAIQRQVNSLSNQMYQNKSRANQDSHFFPDIMRRLQVAQNGLTDESEQIAFTQFTGVHFTPDGFFALNLAIASTFLYRSKSWIKKKCSESGAVPLTGQERLGVLRSCERWFFPVFGLKIVAWTFRALPSTPTGEQIWAEYRDKQTKSVQGCPVQHAAKEIQPGDIGAQARTGRTVPKEQPAEPIIPSVGRQIRSEDSSDDEFWGLAW